MPKLDRIAEKRNTYDDIESANQKAASKIKIAPKPAGQLGSGFTKLDTPKQPEQGHGQTKASRNSVGGRWLPGPGNQRKGKASPSSEESFLKQRKNKEMSKK
jgi:hypothetical protein